MSDYGTMRTRIAREMRRGEITASATAVGAAIASAIQFYETEALFFNEFTDVTATASSSVTLVPFSRFGVHPVEVYSLVVIGSTTDPFPLDRRTFAELELFDSGQTFSDPDFYALIAENVRLYPVPSENVTLRMAGVKRLTEVTACATSAATNGWMTDAEEVIRLRAKSLLFRDELRSPQQASYFEVEAEKARMRLFDRAGSLASAGRVRSSMF